ncbi:MAG: DegT/DnrJ/EryC1/StrS aminotransferase family protein [Chromatiaceae bacterium]|nr:DegT/DnrJ/EryC1/StrS aminotransferase family protein [Chromatiaceae bacterium]MCP5422268.1 DegT/DnrJ/EryC1/StrS aminotransferase family protein [Chromatiaceae bacterium]
MSPPPLANATLPGWPHFDADQIDAVRGVLDSGRVNYWTGEHGRLFEREYADHVGVGHGIALANGSVALELALYALGIGPGDEVIVTPRTFIASASSIVIRGATPVFADVDPISQNITADTIAPHIGPRTRAIICVHLAGWPCDMDPITALARQHGLKVIEDCAQAHGARYRGRPVGSFGDMAAFSFCQDKIITTGGEGGMLVTDDEALWDKAWSYKDHGKRYATVHAPRAAHETGFRWVHESFGSNFRMTEMQAAIGRIQLRRLAEWVECRRSNAAILIDRLAAHPLLEIPVPGADIHHAYYKFYAFLDDARLRRDWSRDRVVGAITARGIPCFSGSCSEVYLEKAFADSPYRQQQRLPSAQRLGERSLMLLVHPTLDAAHMQHTADIVDDVLTQARA